MNSAGKRPTTVQALDLRLKAESGIEDLFGPIAIAADDVAQFVLDQKVNLEVRQAWLEELKPHWDRLLLSPGSQQALEKLKDPNCRVVMTGQQPALWGGPLLCTVKLLAATQLVKDLESRGIPAVALFWIADEDHDVDELEAGRFRSGEGAPVPFDHGRTPISELIFSGNVDGRTQQIRSCLGNAPHAQEVVSNWENHLAGASSPSGEFLCSLMKTLPEECWLPVFPKWLRNLQSPWIQKAFTEAVSFQKSILRASHEQESQGIPAPVRCREGAPFFLISKDGERVRPESQSQSEIEAGLKDPQRLSADALLRGMIQDAIFEPAAVILGPTEWCYTLQTREIRRHWKIAQPLWLPRPSLRPLESEVVEKFAELGISMDRLNPNFDVIEAIPSNRGDLKRMELEAASKDLLERMNQLSQENAANPQLRRKAQRLRQLWLKQLQSLSRSIDLGFDREVEARRNQARQLLNTVFPDGVEPERSRNISDLLAWYGPEIVKQMTKSISASITRWDGRISAWQLPSLNLKCEQEDADAFPE